MSDKTVVRNLFGLLLTAVLLAPGAIAQQQPKTVSVKSLRLYVLDGGVLDMADTSPYRLKKEELATNKMSVAAFLVVHPKGTLLWDAGAVPDNAFKPGPVGTIRFATATKSLGSQLAEVGYMPSSINFLALSHFHWDHIGNANLFAGATWLVTQAERDMMFAEPPSARTEPQNYSSLRNSKTVILKTSEYDVFGDGTVVIVAAPGHSPGHQVLFLKMPKTGPLVLSGDLYHYPEERKLSLIPTTEFNAEQTIQSRAAIEAFLKKTGAGLWIQHDFYANSTLRKSPKFYE